MDNNKLTATLTINPNDFLIPLERTLSECSNAVFTGLAVLDSLTELPKFIYGEDNFMMHKPYGADLTVDQRKTLYKAWLMRKGFEDLIKAVTAMLIDICRVLKINSKLKDTKTWGEFQELIMTPDYEVTTKHFPELLRLIRPNLLDNLTFETEINSINRIRRCLVHRNGFVTPKDLFKDETTLKLCWVFFKIVYIEDGREEEVKSMLLMTGKGQIQVTQEKRIKEFKENERIEITYQLFNELIMTCFLFGQDLITKLTVGSQKKNSL